MMKTKSVLLILVTLIIGFILGMLTSAQIRYAKLKPVKVYFSEDRFRDGFYKTIEPDEQQKEKIDLVLDKYARINSDVHNKFRKELDDNMIEFSKEIDSYLTRDQQTRLKEMDERRRQMIRHKRKNDATDTGNRRHHHRDKKDFEDTSPSGGD